MLRLAEAAEEEADALDSSTAPGYYRMLAILYRKQKRFDDEVAILERYAQWAPSASGILRDRLAKARALAAKARLGR